ncbi:PREDICTED: flavin-containing monooxygenase FMO GS-OX4-like [Ceratosolen solmsi marchali]|uniref:Flavin-containing monooxygenase n=1 Tax=Ceratosolen solmsi marchali TaxID=326594 RepID=A0AAJ6YH66_9HYME|nr:PREDICTED: flavin-containing monooxygenase FMO GS-OX4-like [Ceratosolen solmsi marchali]
MRIAVIGAGAAGLAAIRRSCCSAEVVCYEKSDKVGGTWVYVPETGNDAYGLPIHSSMYESLRTNLPKEVMGYPDYLIPENRKSYIHHDEILAFLNDYCTHFQLRDKIKFLHNVELVEPIGAEEKGTGSNWKLRVRDLRKSTVTEEFFDAVMVCNGHYFKPSLPRLKGHETFKGQQMHSHDYRRPEPFADKRVVVIGAGPSGMDLALEISKKAKRVILSHHLKETILTKFPNNVVQKKDVVELKDNSAVFQDGTSEEADIIFYCTGYEYSFPFLSESCEIKVNDNMITPLWKHVIAIENPTLVFIGIPFYVCAFSMFDLQVRFVLRYLNKEKELPTRDSMLLDESQEKNSRFNIRGFTKRQFHMMGPLQAEYYDDLADTANIERLLPVLSKLHNESSDRFLDDLVHYRDDRYKIIDNENYQQLND